MEKQIVLPFGAKKKLQDEFDISRITLERMILGAEVNNTETKRKVRERALELGGVEKNI